MYNCSTLLKATVLLSYIPNVLSAALQVAAKVPTYYAQCCRKLQCNIVVHSTIIILVLNGRAIYKGPGL